MNPLQIGDITIPIPIIQGGMGVGISLAGLASAVANEGGVGTIATVGLGLIHNSPDKNFKESNNEAVRQEIRKARKASSGIIAVNIMTVLTNFEELVKTAIEEKIDIIFSGAGLPLDLPKYLTEGSKTKLVPIVSSARAAKILAQKWKSNFNYLPDAFVVEGPKAGGHLGFNMKELESDSKDLESLVIETVALTTELKEQFNKDIPVIAAGGISTGKDILHFLELGASGVQLGTQFAACTEGDASINFKNALVEAKSENVRIIKSPVGLPGRAIGNDFLNSAEAGNRKPKNCKYHCIRSCDPKTTSYCIADALLAAYEGRLNDGFAFAGANVEAVERIQSVRELINKLTHEYKEAKKAYL